MTNDRREALCTLACCLMSEVCDTLQSNGANQMHFLSMDSRTNQTVVTVVAQGNAADALLEYLDCHKTRAMAVDNGEVKL